MTYTQNKSLYIFGGYWTNDQFCSIVCTHLFIFYVNDYTISLYATFIFIARRFGISLQSVYFTDNNVVYK